MAMPKLSPVRIPLKLFVEARKTMRAQFAAARTPAPSAVPAERGTPARTALTAFFHIHLEFLAAYPAVAAVLYDGDALPSEERALQEHHKLMLFLLADFEKIVAEGKAAQAVRADVDPAMAAIHCLGAIQMAWTFWTMGGRKGDLAASGLSLFDQVWEGIKI
jgi:hypothetical protein